MHARSLLVPLALGLLLASCPGDDEGGTFILSGGSATLASCTTAPTFDLNGARFSMSGTVKITSDGCDELKDALVNACPLAWDFTQNGNEISILSDGEYVMRARICGDKVTIVDGWWLPFEDAGLCSFLEEDAAEVVIDAPSNELTVTIAVGLHSITGTLTLHQVGRPACTAEFVIVLSQFIIPRIGVEEEQPPAHLVLTLDPAVLSLASDPRAGVLLRDVESGRRDWIPLDVLLGDEPTVIERRPGVLGATLVLGGEPGDSVEFLLELESEAVVELPVGDLRSPAFER